MAEPTFKAVPFEQLSAETKSVIAANAKYQGMSPEQYLESRGGVNKSGYYGDAYLSAAASGRPYLTDEEYAAALQGLTGTARGAAINTATAKKAYDFALSQGLSPDAAIIKSGYDPVTGKSITATRVFNPNTNRLDVAYKKGDSYVFGDGTSIDAKSATVMNMGMGDGSVSTSGNTAGIYTATDGKTFSNADAYVAYQANLDKGTAERKSAYDLLYSQFSQYGLGALVEPLKNLIQEGVSPSEFTLRLRDTDAYKKRFAANAQRINSGLRALSEAEYIQLEDQYQDVMRRYGMPESYYKKGDLGIQQGFEKFISGDVSPVELEDRIQTAQARVFDANPEVAKTLREFYPGITNGDILAYVLDPKTALPELKRKITAAEIGAGAAMAGLTAGLQRATELASYGVTKEQAQQGFQTIADILPRGSQLASIYGQTPYTQTTAEQEVFGLAGATEAAKQRKKLTSLEQAAFSGQTGAAGGALGRERAGQF